MPRPPFTPSDHQKRILAQLGQQVGRAHTADARVSLLIAEAKAAGVPIEHIAKAAGVTVKTVYNRLARLEER